MNSFLEPRPVRHCRRFSLAVSALAVLTGCFVLAGWKLAIPVLIRIHPGFATMKPNTALCFVLCGLALAALHLLPGEVRNPRIIFVRIAQALSGVVAVVGFLTLAEHLLNVDLGIDGVLFHQLRLATGVPHLGRMSIATAAGFFLLGISLLTMESQGRRYLSQACPLLVLLDGFIAFLGYLYGIQELHGVAAFCAMALHTGILFMLLGAATLAARPQLGLMSAITSERLGGLLARRILPFAIVLPVLGGWIRSKGEHAGNFHVGFGLGLFALSDVLMFATLLIVSASWINRVDEARRRSGLRLAAIVESSTDAIVGKDLNGIVTSWNHGAEVLFGYTAQEMLGRSITTLIPSSRRHEEREIFTRINDGKKVEPFETIRQRRDGSLIDVSATISPIRDSQGNVIGAAKIARDITQQKQAAEALRQQAAVLDLAQVLVRDLEDRIVLWNTGAERLYGFTREQALGERSQVLLRSHFSEPLQKIENQVLDTGTWEGEIIHTRSDGTQIVVTSFWVLQRDGQGRPFRILEANVDITARKQAEQQLALQADELAHQAEELARSQEALASQTRILRSVLDSIGDGVIAADTEGNFLLWNPAADRILGQSRQDMPPSEWSSRLRIYCSDNQTAFPADSLPLAKAIHGRAASAEMFIRDANSASGAWIDVSARPIWDEHGFLLGGVAAFRDITQRKLADREIRKLNVELEERVRDRTVQLETANRELESFSYSVSHDLRAPLRQISGFARILQEDFASSMPSEACKHLQRIEDGALNMGKLIDELLNFSRLGRQPLTCRLAGLNSLVADVVSILQPEIIGRQINWRISSLSPAECDPILMKQVFQNLISNSLKYSRTRDCATIEIGEIIQQGVPIVFVRDNGVGFDMNYADKLFAVFQRLHKSSDFEGIGIGLATAQRIIHKHGGHIWADSEPDCGATFYFTLSNKPRAPEPAVRREHSLS